MVARGGRDEIYCVTRAEEQTPPSIAPTMDAPGPVRHWYDNPLVLGLAAFAFAVTIPISAPIALVYSERQQRRSSARRAATVAFFKANGDSAPMDVRECSPGWARDHLNQFILARGEVFYVCSTLDHLIVDTERFEEALAAGAPFDTYTPPSRCWSEKCKHTRLLPYIFVSAEGAPELNPLLYSLAREHSVS
jgi:hypothetical protein